MCPFQNGSSASWVLNKSTVAGKFTYDDLMWTETRVIERESNLLIYCSY